MSAIPISPSSIAGAAIYAAPNSAITLDICKPAQEGVKGIPMQFAFNVNPVWKVQFNGGSGTPAISQLACLYIDASQSTHDVNILFPDTGFTYRVEQGSCRIIPAMTGTTPVGQTPNAFYVIIDSSGELTEDIVNIIALNQFIPEFSTPGLLSSLSYGYGQMFEPTPTFTQSTVFCNIEAVNAFPVTLIDHEQWYITGIKINGSGISTSGNTAFIFELFDNGVLLTASAFTVLASTNNQVEIFDLAGLNIISSGEGPLTCNISGSGLNGGIFVINIYGGVLVS